MRLRVDPFWFLLKLVSLFMLTYFLWKPIAPYYVDVLFHASRAGVWLTELSFDPAWSHGTTLIQVPRHPTGIFFVHRNFDAFPTPLDPQGIPAEWVMANLVLLIPLMLATPAPSWKARFGRLALALAIALVVQVTDIVITIKAFYSSVFAGAWSAWSQQLYGLLDSFVQGFDTQLFPFAIWAGIHFRELMSLAGPGEAQSETKADKKKGDRRAERRRRERGKG